MPRQTLKQRSDGRYRCKYKGRDFYGATQSEALAARDEYRRMEEQGLKAAAKGMTVGEYAARWLPIHKVGIRAKTYNGYQSLLQKLCDHIGDRPLVSVTASDIKAVFSDFIGQSDSHISHAKNLYKSMFDTAVEDGYTRSNPCRSPKAQPHKGTSGTHRPITQEERYLILTTPHRMQPAAMAMLYAGLRRGEARGVIIDRDVDFTSKRLTISETVHVENNVPIVEKSAKTKAGLRSIPLFLPLEEILRGKSGLLAPSAKGTLCTETAFRRAWESYMVHLSNAAGHPVNIRCHDLRHSFCTMLRDAGVDLKLAIKWMGHADEKMILKIYDHITPEREQKAIEFVQKELSGGQNGGQNQS